MKENEMKPQADPVLDAELAQMAEEVPPMPSDFHEKWMNAVRAEAQKSAPAAENTDKTEAKPPVSLTRWTRILSIAAVFVFLIGGTILYRNSRKTLTTAAFRTEAKNAVMAAEEMTAAGTVSDEREEAEFPGGNAAEGAVMMAAESAVSETVYEDYAVSEEAASYEGAAEYAAADYAAEEEAGISEAAEADLSAYEAAPMAAMKAAEAPVPTGMPTEAPAESAMESMTEAEEAPEAETVPEAEKAPEQEAEAEPEKTGFMQQAGAFLTDMGDFLLAALPYLAVLAVPAAAALVIRRKKK